MTFMATHPGKASPVDANKEDQYSVYFWSEAICPHLTPLFREALSHPRISKAAYVAETDVEDFRKDMGWAFDLPTGGEILIGPDREKVEHIVQDSGANAVHVFYGIHWVPSIVEGLKSSIKHKRHFGIFSEPRVLEGGKGVLRLAHSLLTEGQIRKHADFVLVVGAHGPSWFSLVGYDPEAIFPAAYFLERAEVASDSKLASTENGTVNVAFVGRLEPVKGFDLFLKSIPLVKSPANFSVVGTGSLAPMSKELATSTPNLRHIGVLPMAETRKFLSETDILVLPSTTTNDGWGAVISEALMAGAAVIASSKVGASICVDTDAKGIVLKRNTPGEIAKAIDTIVDGGFLTPQYRRERSQWAQAHLDSAAGIEYLLAIFDHLYKDAPKPRPYLI